VNSVSESANQDQPKHGNRIVEYRYGQVFTCCTPLHGGRTDPRIWKGGMYATSQDSHTEAQPGATYRMLTSQTSL